MHNAFKYLNVSEFDKHWGLYLNVAGNKTVQPGELYPNPRHPSGYFFSWEKGRILTEYQINYVTDGCGKIETKKGIFTVQTGALMIIKPGMWHRYRPDIKTGWTENYIGFNGEIVKGLFETDALNFKNPVINIGKRGELLDTYLKIFDLVDNESPGYQQVTAGMVMKLIGYIVAFEKQKGYSGNRIEKIIKQACYVMRDNITGSIEVEKIASDNNVGYAYFRKMFKKYTGLSPLQYYNNLKIIKAKELLLATDMRIKEISDTLGFQTVYYFSRLFKNKTGITPSEYKAQNSIK